MDLPSLSDEELSTLRTQVEEEIYRRNILASAPVYVEANSRAFLTARDGNPDPENPPLWVQPTTVPYPMDYLVVWPEGGPVYQSIHHANVWEPGSEHGQTWVRKDPDPEPGEYIPWAIGQAVVVDDLRSHDGRLWKAKVAHTTHAGWEPGPASYAVWEDLGPLEESKR